MVSGCPPIPAIIARMNIKTCKIRKQQFMQAVQILAPGDQFIYQAAQRIPEEKLSAYPGGAALEVVVAFQKLREPINIPIKPNPHPSTAFPGHLSLSHAISVKSAELWMELGEADQALRELEALPRDAWNHPAAVEVRVAALEVLDGRTGTIGQAVLE